MTDKEKEQWNKLLKTYWQYQKNYKAEKLNTPKKALALSSMLKIEAIFEEMFHQSIKDSHLL